MRPILAFTLFSLAACTEHGSTPKQHAIVLPARVPCEGFGPQLCLVLVPDAQPMERLFFGIEGYTHRWGIESEIQFRRETVEEPIPDGPGELVILVELINENQTINGSFEMPFPQGFGGWFSGAAPALNMLGTTVQCATEICDQLLLASSNGQPFNVTMELVDDQTLRATAVDI